MAKDAIFEGSREVRTYVDLWHGANVLLIKTEEDQKGSYYTAMGSLLLRAFTFEAYLNHIGSQTFDFWKEIELLNVRQKYNVLCKRFGLNPDDSRRPYQTLQSLFNFRNAIAHGRSKILGLLAIEVDSKSDPYKHTPKAHWEEYCTPQNAQRAKKDVSEIIAELHKAAGLGDYPFNRGMSSGSISMKSPNK